VTGIPSTDSDPGEDVEEMMTAKARRDVQRAAAARAALASLDTEGC
jgi:hypothetical protein